MADLLDWHVQEARGAGKSYADPACRVFPVEIIAIRHVREWLELPMPRIDHPLMHGNLATMRPQTNWPQHEFAAGLERQARSHSYRRANQCASIPSCLGFPHEW